MNIVCILGKHAKHMPVVYIVRCADNTLYTGWTLDLEKRLHAHNTSKTGARYTRSRRPVAVVYVEPVATPRTARQREALIKRLTRSQKELLINQKISC